MLDDLLARGLASSRLTLSQFVEEAVRAATTRKCARRWTGSSLFKTMTAAGARTGRATSSTIAAMNGRRPPRHRRPGRCSASWPPARSIIPRSRAAFVYFADTQGADGFWNEPRYTATGFPRVFYLRYHGYAKFFPLWAMARYRNLQRGDTRAVAYGMSRTRYGPSVRRARVRIQGIVAKRQHLAGRGARATVIPINKVHFWGLS